MARAFYDGNSNLLKITGLTNARTGAVVTDLSGVTVTAVLLPQGSAVPVTGGSLTLAFIAASQGDWQATFPNTVGVTLGAAYRVELTADGGASLTGKWVLSVKVLERTT